MPDTPDKPFESLTPSQQLERFREKGRLEIIHVKSSKPTKARADRTTSREK